VENMPLQQSSTVSRGYSIALVSSIILSTTAIFIRYLTETYQMPSLILAFWREGFVVLTLLPILGLTRPFLLRVKRDHVLYLVGYGVVLALFNSSWTMSVAMNGATVATVLVYCSAAFTAVLARLFLQEALNWIKVAVIGLTIGGTVMVSGAYETAVWITDSISLITGIGSGLLYAIYSLMGRSASQRGLNPWTTLLYTFGFASLFLLGINLCTNGFFPETAQQPADMLWLGAAFPGWGILILLAAGPTLAGFGLYNVSLGYLPSSVANLVLTSEPAFTAVIAYLFLGEMLDSIQISGSLLILSGVVILRLYNVGTQKAT
jgi:drug/metabolite transporter (DMT)-like permease